MLLRDKYLDICRQFCLAAFTNVVYKRKMCYATQQLCTWEKKKTQDGNMTPCTFSDHEPPWRYKDTDTVHTDCTERYTTCF